MQTITLIALGKLNADYYAKAAAEYAKRLSAYCRLNIVELPEEPIAEKKRFARRHRQGAGKRGARHSDGRAQGQQPGGVVRRRKTKKTSEELAAYLDERAGSGAGDVAFVIGSSHGLADSVNADGVSAAFHEQNDIPAPACAGDAAGAALPRVFHQPRRKIPQVTQSAPRTAGRTPDRCAGRFFAAAVSGR